MIIIQLKGGLGNQMFQYALGVRLSQKLKRKVKYDIEFFKSDLKRKLELTHLNIPLEIANKREVLSSSGEKLPYGIKGIDYRFQNYFLPYYKHRVVVEPVENYYKFDNNIFKIRKRVFIKGYWQSEGYFKENIDTLKDCFKSAKELDKDNKSLRNKLLRQNSVSIHIRGTDYLNTYYDVCGSAYYKKAILFLSERFENLKFYVFSDQPEMIKSLLTPSISYEIVSLNTKGNDSYKDLFLMSYCKHNIIANSSFSWWGAKLNNFPSKRIIAPAEWLKGKPTKELDIIPKKWTII